MKRYLVFAGMGFEIVGLIVGAFYLGDMIDKKYNTNGLAFVGLSFLGLVGWLVRVIWLIKRIQKDDGDE